MAAPSDPPLVYILSDVRSGSTLLDMMLSANSEVVSVGEMRHLNSHIVRRGVGHSWHWLCTCGESLETCTFWSEILDKIANERGIPWSEVDTFVRISRSRFGLLRQTLAARRGRLDRYFQRTEEHRNNVKRAQMASAVYQEIFRFHGKAIVDSSKSPEYLFYISESNLKQRLRTVFLTRDSRAVARSRLKWTQRSGRSGRGALHSLYAWVAANQKALNVLRYLAPNVPTLVVRYEDLASQPASEIARIADFLAIEVQPDMHRLDLRGKHNIAGTPNRFAFQGAEIVLDEAWKQSSWGSRTRPVYWLGALANRWMSVQQRLLKTVAR